MRLEALLSITQEATREGRTLPWAIQYLLARLEESHRCVQSETAKGKRRDEVILQMHRLHSQALALVLTGLVEAYAAGLDLEHEKQHTEMTIEEGETE